MVDEKIAQELKQPCSQPKPTSTTQMDGKKAGQDKLTLGLNGCSNK
jgi:hypothetical protein